MTTALLYARKVALFILRSLAAVGLTCLLTWHGFLMLVARIDTPEEFRLLRSQDLVIGPLTSLTVFLWLHPLPRKWLGRVAWPTHVALALVVSLAFLAIHCGQVSRRSGLGALHILFTW